MDFVETVFHIAPDGGSGTLEALLVFTPLAIAALAALARRARGAATSIT